MTHETLPERCPDCGHPREHRICADCGAEADVIDCGHYEQPAEIAAGGSGAIPAHVCPDCVETVHRAHERVVADLAEALKPFAAFADEVPECPARGDILFMFNDVVLLHSDCVNALAALKRAGKD